MTGIYLVRVYFTASERTQSRQHGCRLRVQRIRPRPPQAVLAAAPGSAASMLICVLSYLTSSRPKHKKVPEEPCGTVGVGW